MYFANIYREFQISRQGARRSSAATADCFRRQVFSWKLKLEFRKKIIDQRRILLYKTKQESDQAVAESAAWLITASGGGEAAHRLWRRLRITFDSASSYAEFAYKLIKTTQELLQETDSDIKSEIFLLVRSFDHNTIRFKRYERENSADLICRQTKSGLPLWLTQACRNISAKYISKSYTWLWYLNKLLVTMRTSLVTIST